MVLDLSSRVDLASAAVYGVLFLIGVPLFALRRKHEPIRSRGWAMAICQTLIIALDFVTRNLFFNDVINCRFLWFVSSIMIPVSLYPYFIRCWFLWLQYTQQTLFLAPKRTGMAARITSWFFQRPFLLTTHFQLILLFGIFSLGVLGFLPVYLSSNGDCQSLLSFFILACVILAQELFALVLMCFCLYLLWGKSDAFFIRFEIYVYFLIGLPGFVLYCLAAILGWQSVPPSVFLNVSYILFILATIWAPLLLSYRFDSLLRRNRRRRVEVGSVHSISTLEEEFRVVLHNHRVFPYFEKFCVQSFSVEHLLLHRKVLEFKNSVPVERSALAQQMVDQFLTPGSNQEINVDSSVRAAIIDQVRSQEFPPDLFDQADQESLLLLEHSIFPLWKGSQAFSAMLKELGAAELVDLGLDRKRGSADGVKAKEHPLTQDTLSMVNLERVV